MRTPTFPSAALLTALLCGCATTSYDPTQPISFAPGEAIPIDAAATQLAGVVGKRITLSGVPRQREGSCRGAQPISNHDWMLTGKTECIWVNGRAPGANLMDVRTGLSDDPVEVTGILAISDQGSYVLKADRDPPPVRSAPPSPPVIVPAPESLPTSIPAAQE